MDLRERLRLLKVAATQRDQESRPAPTSGTGSNGLVGSGGLAGGEMTRVWPAGSDRASAIAGGCLDGYVLRNGSGEAFCLETRYPVEYLRGPLSLEHIFAVPGAAWETIGRVPATADMRSAVFFDTETTGLAGGTGTHAFLIGLGYFEGFDFVLKQYFLRDYPEEDALLEALAGDLARFSLLVTFNGKAFDWPLMETRYRLSRRRVPLAGIPHLDLLHPARRVWKGRLAQCNLTNLEAQVLGVRRMGDVPGHLIPQLYFDYLRSGDATPLLDVVLHNRLDILSLVALATWLGRIVTDPLSPTADGELVPGDDLYALARLFEARGRSDEALVLYEAAVDRGAVAISPRLMMQELARAYKRLRRHDRALPIWEQMAGDPAGPSLHALVEMAKYYEHVARDIDRAHALAHEALAVAERRRSITGAGAGAYALAAAADVQDLQHRISRLTRKRQR
ncbi:MAG TPA: ribonuclease H-like domain-containing protein [Symbiobacteriaceae bacterium]|jgi:hypothetical protein